MRRITSLALPALLAACTPQTSAPVADGAAQPSALSKVPVGKPAVQSGTAAHAMVAAANPLAVEAGLRILRQGGSAVDAAVAIQAVLGLVEPQSSGIGGGAFLVHYDAATHKVTAYDGREVAPAGATPQLFLDESGKPLPFYTAVLSGRSTGVPGAIAMLAMAQKDHGTLPWSSLFTDAAALARNGFIVSPRLAELISGNAPQASAPDARRYFTKPDGTQYGAGDRLRNPAYADTLDRIARQGPAGLLQGPIAQDIVRRVHEGERPGTLSLTDLEHYQPHRSEALCRPYRIYIVCTPQAPSGGPGLQEALGILAQTDIDTRNAQDPFAWFQFAQASRLAYADRDRYIGDPAFVKVPVEGLLDPAYLKKRAALIGQTAGPAPSFGYPEGAPKVGVDATVEPGGTSHFIVVDAKGNVVSITTTVENIFGSGRMVDGFFLNNQLTDFSFAPTNKDGTPAANAVAAGKRPRSTMAPTIVLDNKRDFVAALGSPGGSAIQAYNLKTAVAMLDWDMSPQASAALPNLYARGDSFAGGDFAPNIIQGLAKRGIVFKASGAEGSGIQAIRKTATGYVGGADPRREGMARGF